MAGQWLEAVTLHPWVERERFPPSPCSPTHQLSGVHGRNDSADICRHSTVIIVVLVHGFVAVRGRRSTVVCDSVQYLGSSNARRSTSGLRLNSISSL